MGTGGPLGSAPIAPEEIVLKEGRMWTLKARFDAGRAFLLARAARRSTHPRYGDASTFATDPATRHVCVPLPGAAGTCPQRAACAPPAHCPPAMLK